MKYILLSLSLFATQAYAMDIFAVAGKRVAAHLLAEGSHADFGFLIFDTDCNACRDEEAFLRLKFKDSFAPERVGIFDFKRAETLDGISGLTDFVNGLQGRSGLIIPRADTREGREAVLAKVKELVVQNQLPGQFSRGTSLDSLSILVEAKLKDKVEPNLTVAQVLKARHGAGIYEPWLLTGIFEAHLFSKSKFREILANACQTGLGGRDLPRH